MLTPEAWRAAKAAPRAAPAQGRAPAGAGACPARLAAMIHIPGGAAQGSRTRGPAIPREGTNR
jgi:hypothetical protein